MKKFDIEKKMYTLKSTFITCTLLSKLKLTIKLTKGKIPASEHTDIYN